ncbi:N-6 DNA methylase [Ktedonobacter racemifer]|uniref:site-specific DNA-methyltransferase (adenine-specific) n=1 Tax=Ktedonobacter racemifer DSM 44963 TaxID=485913 RepID=D6TX43_KTERA|nr:N-6 DNA methylase [Ktedonobacter racemifer]EFH84776.1 N-6 DNA methylase [Ktedonobacter racemifer DSM 44963]
MLSPRLRQQVFALWTMFWSSGMNNPLTAIEQITYLLFLKRLETLDRNRLKQGKLSIYGRRPNCRLPHHPDDSIDIDQRLPEGANPVDYQRCSGHGTCRWSYIARPRPPVKDPESDEEITTHKQISQYAFPWLRVLDDTLRVRGNGNNGERIQISTPMEDAYFQFPGEKGGMLERALIQVDNIFKYIGSANEDIMGDIFEYLLSEIEASGKNGQFRTPRHIIRFMIELLDPQFNELICDPAAGSGGFLINSIQHVLKKYSEDTVIYEWNGTPHRIYGVPPKPYPTPESCTGYDNDRTMVRIGWMNMILHGIENPRMILRDALSQRMEDQDRYDVVLANPPFAGQVDVGDVHPDLPRHPNNRHRPITDKSDLLFLWQTLRILKNGGRAAVILPEGVLFGSTNAHKELRRQLLLENIVDGVISLPAGVFSPYTGVKTSILIFHKHKGEYRAGQEPVTKSVWFYDVSIEGYSRDAKRRERPEENDLWDAMEKWSRQIIEDTKYSKPEIETVRWRLVDEEMLKIFPEYRESLEPELDKSWGLHELFKEFADLPSHHPESLKAYVQERTRPRIEQLYTQALAICEASLRVQERSSSEKVITENITRAVRDLNRVFDAAKRRDTETGVSILERGQGLPEFGRKALEETLNLVRQRVEEEVKERVVRLVKANRDDFGPLFASDSEQKQEEPSVLPAETPNWVREAEAIVKEFAKLDGYDVRLLKMDEEIDSLTRKRKMVTKKIQEFKSWRVPVRVFLPNLDWTSPDSLLQGSHDEKGELRPEYVQDPSLYNNDGTVRKELLDPDCLEYNDFYLSAGRYKPFELVPGNYDPPERIIRELQDLETKIQEGLSTLLAMVEERE